MYIRMAKWCYENRVKVVVAWLVLLVVVLGIAGGLGNNYNEQFESLDSESDRGAAILQEEFGGQGASYLQGNIVVKVPAGIDTPQAKQLIDSLAAQATKAGLTVVSPFDEASNGRQISSEEPIAYISIEADEAKVTQTETAKIGETLLAEGNKLAAEVDGAEVEIGGSVFAKFEPPESEVIGIAFAIVILIVAFGSVLAMGLPLAVAIAGVGAGLGLTSIASHLTTMPQIASIIGVMIGLGVGIDYALFVVTRYREGLHNDLPPGAATAAAGDIATRAVVFAGLTVVVSLLGLLLIGLKFVAGMGIAAALTVAMTILATVTLLPALLGFARLKVEVTRWRGLVAAGLVSVGLLGVGFKLPTVTLIALPLAALVLIVGSFIPTLKQLVPRPEQKPIEESVWYRWSHLIQRRPWPFLLVGVALLAFLAVPLLDIRLAFTDEGNYPQESTTRQAYDLLSEGFGPGYNGPFTAVTRIDDPADIETLTALGQAIDADTAVAAVSPVIPNGEVPTAAMLQVYSKYSPQDVETEHLVNRLRDDVVPAAGDSIDVQITGLVPSSIDFSDYMASRSLVFFAVVLILSFVLLMVVFRSILVPFKAVIMNMLSIAAAYGVVVALFQWGHLSSITGITPGPIEPFVPMMLFAIVFGLSMDYEVFLLSRVKEEYERTHDANNSVADGLASTARVISAAAAIMVVVFGAFLLEDNRISKVFGTGLSVAVFLDATLVRMLLVPATMELLGERNWWIPKWLNRILPRLDVEGSPDHDERIGELAAAEIAANADAADADVVETEKVTAAI